MECFHLLLQHVQLDGPVDFPLKLKLNELRLEGGEKSGEQKKGQEKQVDSQIAQDPINGDPTYPSRDEFTAEKVDREDFGAHDGCLKASPMAKVREGPLEGSTGGQSGCSAN